MQREPKTAQELQEMIKEECDHMPILSIGVEPDKSAQGWFAITIADPSVVGEMTAHVNAITDRLGAKYSLIEEYKFNRGGFTFVVAGTTLREYAAARGDMRDRIEDLGEAYKGELTAAAARAMDAGVSGQRVEIRSI